MAGLMAAERWRSGPGTPCKCLFPYPVESFQDTADLDQSTYRNLDEKPGIFTFIGIGRKEGIDDRALSLQVYVTPELYENPRI